MSARRLILASASPARLNILQSAGIDADVVVSDVDESTVESSDPRELSRALATLKARTVADRVDQHDTLILGCDSVLGLDGEVLGKPSGPADAKQRWLRMRGRAGVLYTGHCLIAGERDATAVAETTVHFGQLTDGEIDAYIATGEPLRVAGAFTIDGLGGPFIDSITGDPGTVIGLSLPLLRRMLADLGIPITSLWRVG